MVHKLISSRQAQNRFTYRLRGNKLGLDLQRDLASSLDEPAVRPLEQRAGKVVVSRGIVDMDLLLRTGRIRLVRIAFYIDIEGGRQDMNTNLDFALLAGSTVTVRDTVSMFMQVVDLPYQALDMYFPLFIFFAGRSVDSALAAAVSLAAFLFLVPSWSSVGVVSRASSVAEAVWSTASLAGSQSCISDGDITLTEL